MRAPEAARSAETPTKAVPLYRRFARPLAAGITGFVLGPPVVYLLLWYELEREIAGEDALPTLVWLLVAVAVVHLIALAFAIGRITRGQLLRNAVASALGVSLAASIIATLFALAFAGQAEQDVGLGSVAGVFLLVTSVVLLPLLSTVAIAWFLSWAFSVVRRQPG